MKVIGLTGGIGMGKSKAAELLRARGVPVVDTDVLARQLVEPGQPALAEIQAAFGPQVIGSGGSLRRDVMARLVFADPASRERLEGILHPRIRSAWLARMDQWRAENHPCAVVVIPLLYETRAETACDHVVCVACTADTQMRRLMGRGWGSAQIRQRLAAQMPVADKIARADFLVWTETSVEIHAAQLDRIFRRWINAVARAPFAV